MAMNDRPSSRRFRKSCKCWVIQRRSSTGFASKTFQGLRIVGDVFRQEFEGNETVKTSVFGLIDHTHAAATELLDNAVVRNSGVDHVPARVAVDD